MPWSGGSFTRTNGVHTGATLWAQDRDAGTKILATRHDTHDQDLADGINATLEKSGSNAATGNLDIGSNRITALADGTAKTDAATVNQIQSNGPAFQATDTGTANAYVIALSPAITAYAAGQAITFKAGAASTTASTLNVNGLGTKALKKLNDQDIASGDIESGSIVTAVYDGTSFQVTSQLASEPAGAGAAYSGILQANANFVDQVIFGPSIDGAAWNGAWTKSGVYSSLMLATIEDEGSNTEINIWDLTEETAGVISTTPLATVDLASAATPTSIAASMGYLIIGSEDGIAIVDPHSGAWAERTVGWPKTLSTSTAPALASNDVIDVCAAVIEPSPSDPRTGGSLPTFGCLYAASESSTASLIKTNGDVPDITETSPGGSIGFQRENFLFPRSATSYRQFPEKLILADFHPGSGDSYVESSAAWPFGFFPTTAISTSSSYAAWASTAGASFRLTGDNLYATGIASVNRTYNTGFFNGDIAGVWLANSKTADRGPNSLTLTENGTIVQEEVASGTELMGYVSFSASNNFSRASHASWDAVGTGALWKTAWVKTTTFSGTKTIVAFGNSGNTVESIIYLSSGSVAWRIDGATAQDDITGGALPSGVWSRIDAVQISSTERYLYVNGVEVNSSTTDIGSLTDSGNMPLYIRVWTDGSSNPASTEAISLVRVGHATGAPSATDVRTQYHLEKGMFAANAECLLQSGSTDAVLDVNVDPLTGKVLVTQTDAITVFDGCVVDSKPTVNSGTSEKGKLFGALRAEQNSANAYVTAPADDQRQINEMVRSLSSDLPKTDNLGEAKAWFEESGKTSSAMKESYNISSLTRNSTGVWTVNFSVPMADEDYVVMLTADGDIVWGVTSDKTTRSFKIYWYDKDGSVADTRGMAVVFGRLENE